MLWLVLYVYADGAWGGKARVVLGTLHWAAHVSMMIALYFAVSCYSFWLVDAVWPQAKTMLQILELKTAPRRARACCAPS